MRDPYSILGVRRDAGSDEIKAAWRSKAKTSHPDQNQDDPSATQRFAEIGQAYDLLKDKDKRTRYDQRLSQMESMKREQTIMQQREEARAAAERARQAKANAERIMADLARIEAERAKAEKAAEALNVKVEAARVKAKAAEAQATSAASAQSTAQANANASAGANTGAQQQRASTSGQASASATSQSQTAQDSTTDERTAEAVENLFAAKSDAGKKLDDDNQSRGFAIPVIGLITSLVRRIRKPAPVLEKAPDITVEATIAIDDLLQHNVISLHLSDGRDLRLPLEPGHTDGSIVRMEGKGLKVTGMQTGDLLATLRILRAGPFTVDGYDIHCALTLPLEDAVLGCETTVEGPEGPVNITVPPWSGSEQSIRMDGLGLPSGPNERGALVVDIRVTLWEKPSEKLRDLMKVMKHGLFL